MFKDLIPVSFSWETGLGTIISKSVSEMHSRSWNYKILSPEIRSYALNLIFHKLLQIPYLNMWVNVFKNEPSKICRRETLTSLDPYNVAINKAWEQRDKVLENYQVRVLSESWDSHNYYIKQACFN